MQLIRGVRHRIAGGGRRIVELLSRLVPLRIAEARLLAKLRSDKSWLPPSNIELAFEITRRLRRLSDPGGANRWLHYRWVGILEATWTDIQTAGFEPPRAGFRYLCLGPGTRNPFAFALLIRLAGASEITLVEPDSVPAEGFVAEWGLQELLLRVFSGDVKPREPQLDLALAFGAFGVKRLLASGVEPALVDGRVRVVQATIEEANLPDGSFDFVSSRSVLEHVADIDACYRRLAAVTASGGLMYHDIDLSAHEADRPLALYQRPKSQGLNEARLSDHTSLLVRHGFDPIVVRTAVAPLESLDRSAVELRFQRYNDDDLRCTRAVIVSRRL